MSIEFKQVSYQYAPKTPFAFMALKDIDLKIAKHKITALIGHTGSGKSTLIQHLNALLVPSQGQLQVDDFVIRSDIKNKGLKELRKKVGLVFQFAENQLFEETILKDVMFGPLNFKIPPKEAQQKAIQALETVSIAASLHHQSPFDLSGGQKRRVALAGILALEPEIIVADEPTAGLDPQGAKQILQLFATLNKQENKTIILVTHDMDAVFQYADEVVVLKEGQVAHCSDKLTFFQNQSLLESLHMRAPLILQTITYLNQHGFNIPYDTYDVDNLVQHIKKELR